MINRNMNMESFGWENLINISEPILLDIYNLIFTWDTISLKSEK